MENNVEEFSFSYDSPIDGKNYSGRFKVKIRLSHREQIAIDARRRQILGNDPNNAAPLMNNYAFAVAKLQVQCLESPSWLKDNGFGLDFEDTDLLMKVFDQVYALEEAYATKLAEKTAKARETLKEATK